MHTSPADTQPVQTVGPRPSCLRRILHFLLLIICAAGIFAFGYATGSGVEILAPANAVIQTAIASFLDTTQPTAAVSRQPAAPPLATRNDAAVARLLTPDHLTLTRSATATAAPPSETPIPTATQPPPTRTPVPTATEPPPTWTPLPTTTQPPPTSTTAPTAAPACYRHPEAWVTGDMNVRRQPSIHAQKVNSARAGERFDVLESQQADTYCWLRIDRGWMAVTALVRSTKPQQPAPSSASGGVRQALANLNALVVAPEHRCSPYDSDSYPYSQSVEGQIVARMGGRIYGPYTGTTFSSTRETDIEHIVAKSEAHDSGLCSAGAQTRRTFSNDLLNLTLASPSVNRHQKSGKDFAEWRPALNQCWFADTIIKVKAKYRLTVDSREKAALERTLLSCNSVSMIFSGAARSVAPTAAPARQPATTSQQQQQPAGNQQSQPDSGDWRQWDGDGNGRITCAEARAAGLSLPVRRGHPAYPRMRDSDGDGQVCE